MKLPNIQNPLKLFAPAATGPALATAGPTGGNMMFASSGSGGGGYDDDDNYYDDDYGFDDEPQEPQRPQSNRTRRSAAATDTTGGRSRSASYQPEERYWTDYLRIALPVIGIVLMLGLLWIWASQLLGGDSDNNDTTNNETVGLVSTATVDPNALAPTNESTPTTGGNTIPVSNQTTTQPTNPPADLTATETPQAGGDSTSGTDENATTEENASTGGTFEVDQYVSVTEDDVNMREDASTDATIVRTIPQGELFTIRSGPEEADGYTWWEVISDTEGDSGWIAEDFLVAADEP
ncbi:MAG: SH3 domain-containing protein [Thermomicrobiales bacterium]|nr:SH3 domain-containing protein [Thermomicrobiales bacterium]